MSRISTKRFALSLKKSPLLIQITLCFLIGLVLARSLSIQHGLVAFVLVAPLVVAALYGLFPSARWLLLLFTILGLMRGVLVWGLRVEPSHWGFAGLQSPRSFEAVVTGPLSSGDGWLRAGVRLVGMQGDDGWRKASGRLLLYIPEGELFTRGDRVRFFGKPRVPTHYRVPGVFDFGTFLGRRGFSGVVTIERGDLAMVVKGTPAWRPRALIDRIRWAGIARLEGVVPSPHLGWMETVLLNWRLDLSQETWVSFQRSGQAHLLSVSGLHIGFFFGLIFVPFRWLLGLKRRWLMLGWHTRGAAIIAAGASVIYALVTGGEYPAIRGALFALAGLGVFLLDRRRDLWRVLVASFFLLVIVAPWALGEASFQLSFAAVAGIGLALTGFERYRKKIRGRYLIALVLTTVGATGATLPIVLHHFGQWSGLSFIASLVLIPFFGFVIFPASLLVFAVSWLDRGVGSWTSAVLKPIFDFFLDAVSWFAAKGDGLTLWWRPSGLSTACWLLAFSLVGVVLFRPSGRWWKGVGVGLACVLMVVPYLISTWRGPSLAVTFLDVGQGDAALVECPRRGVILIDAGAVYGETGRGNRQPFDLGERVVLPYLQTRGIRKIDLAVLSHPHPDHYGGLTSIVRRVEVKEVWWNRDAEGMPSLDPLREWFRKKGVSWRVVSRGDSKEFSDVRIDVLWPASDSHRRWEVNDQSIVVKGRWKERSVLWTGDIERDAEEALIREGDLEAEVLKVPHHGSRSSSSPDFLIAVAPRYAMISSGRHNPFGVPHPEVVERYAKRGIPIFRTDQVGTVRFKSSRGGWTVRSETAKDPPRPPPSTGVSSFLRSPGP